MSNPLQPNPKKQEEYFQTMLEKLFRSIKHLPQNSPLHEMNLYKRILNSRMNISHTDEQQTINSLLDQVDKLNSQKPEGKLEKIGNFQSLYSRLTRTKTINRRWPILYSLFRLSQFNNSTQVNMNILDGWNKSNSNNYNIEKMYHDINVIKDPNAKKYVPNTDDIQSKITKSQNKKPSPIVVNMSKTTKIITEKDIINDLMFVFQGIDGHYITFNNNKDVFCLNPNIPFNENIIDIVSFLCELGWLYKKVSNFLNFFNESGIPSQFIQSFSYAVQSELNEYYKLISFFKKKNAQNDNQISNNANASSTSNSFSTSSDDLSLKNLVLWTTEPIERMKWLAMSCESVFALRGSEIISQIYSYVNFSGGEIYLNRVLEEISKPFFTFIKNWIQYGDLQDPYKEFFVYIVDKINDDDLWNLQYQIVCKNIPNFLNKNLAIKIFEVGKCIHFIRNYCRENAYSLSKIKEILKGQIKLYEKSQKEEKEREEKEKEKMEIDFEDINNNNNINNKSISFQQKQNQNQIQQSQYIDIESYKSCLYFLTTLEDRDNAKNNSMEFLTSLISQIDLIHKLINKELVDIFYNKFHFIENLNSINRYLLLGQGDMMQSLMESLFEELKKPASHIYKHNLQAYLEAAIRASNAQFNDQECLKKLNIKLLDSSTGDTGWDIFLLEYNVEVPLTVVFNKSVLKEYQKLFFFFWKLKRLEFSQNHQIWRKFMTYSHSLKQKFEYMREVIHRAMLFNQQVIHFVSNLHNFLALEVLETQYKKIIEVLPSINSLDELIFSHKKFVDNIINQSLLNMENNAIYKKIIQIFELIIRFRTALDVLTTTFLEGHYENMSNFAELSDGMNFKQFSNEASNQITNLFEKFKVEIIELINTVELMGKGNMKYLALKLDYNYYYSRIKDENENKQQKEILEKIERENEMNKQHEEEYHSEVNEFGDINDEFKEEPSELEYGNYEENEHINERINHNGRHLIISDNEEEINTNRKYQTVEKEEVEYQEEEHEDMHIDEEGELDDEKQEQSENYKENEDDNNSEDNN